MATTKNEIVKFEPNQVAVFGNKVVLAINMVALAEDEAKATLDDAAKRNYLIDAELVRVGMHLHKEEKIDLHAVYGAKEEVSKLIRNFKVETGMMKREYRDDAPPLFTYTDNVVANLYSYDAALKEKDEQEYKQRHSRNVALQSRFKRIFKAALSLVEAKATVDDVVTSQNEDTGELQVEIRKGPKDFMGKAGKVVVATHGAKAGEGAKVSPTLAGLVKVSDNKHKAPSASTGTAESEQKQSGDAGVVSEEDFLATLNTAMRVIKGREGEFSKPEQTAMKSLLTTLGESGIK